MPLNLRRAIVRNGLMVGGLCLAVSLALSAFNHGGIDMSVENLMWPVALALGIGLFTAWQVTAKIKKGVLNSIPRSFSQVQLTHGQSVNGVELDWQAIDDYAIQLETRGFVRLGDFSPYPLPKMFVGVAACFVDRNASTLVEIQYIQMNKKAPASVGTGVGGLHISMMSALGGNITASTSDHVMKATNHLIRGEYTVAASFPGMSLLELLDKHTRLIAHLRDKCGKVPLHGLTMERYVYLQRERMAQARKRVEAMSGYAIARTIDSFESAPRSYWSSSSTKMAALPVRPFSELDNSLYAVGQTPAIITFDQVMAASPNASDAIDDTATPEPAPDAFAAQPAADSAQSGALRPQIESSANWFYWVAALSLINILVALAGSNWAFAIGLGIPQVLTTMAADAKAHHGGMTSQVWMLWMMSSAIPVFFLVCGWFARQPSLAAFVIGFALFVFDSLIFLLAGDWIGVGFHALVLYYLWKGIAATRQFRRANSTGR